MSQVEFWHDEGHLINGVRYPHYPTAPEAFFLSLQGRGRKGSVCCRSFTFTCESR